MLTKAFLDYLCYERNYSEKTVMAYQKDISLLLDFSREMGDEGNPCEVTPELIREWIVSLMDAGYTASSVNPKICRLEPTSTDSARLRIGAKIRVKVVWCNPGFSLFLPAP